jgi:hypothetical protein
MIVLLLLQANLSLEINLPMVLIDNQMSFEQLESTLDLVLETISESSK